MSKAPKEKIIPEQFPLVLGGEKSWVKRGQYAKQIADQCAIKFDAEIQKTHVLNMLDAMDAGKTELPADNPDEFHKTFEIVKNDYEMAVEKVQDELAEEEKKAAEEERKQKEKEEADEKTFLAVKDETASFTDLLKKFDTGDMDRFVPKKDVTDTDLLVAVNSAARMSDFSNWMKGDLIVALEDRGMLGVVTKLVEATGQPFSNFYNASKTARAIPPDKRAGAKYTIFAEIANAKFSKDAEENKKIMGQLVDKAAKGEFTSQTARAAVQEAKGKTPPSKVAPEENTKAQFIVINHESERVEIVTGFPKELGKDWTILDPRNLKEFTSMQSKPENRWKEITEYKAPETTEKKKKK